jgi:allophanate hydrolase
VRHARDNWQDRSLVTSGRYLSERPQQLTRVLADPALRRQRYPLLGVPFAVKDNIDIAGHRAALLAALPLFGVPFAHHRGLPGLHPYRVERNANVVQRLLDAGAVWIGKTNLDQFATGLVGTRSPYGQPASVADPSRISGGSSSGSAVAGGAGAGSLLAGHRHRRLGPRAGGASTDSSD